SGLASSFNWIGSFLVGLLFPIMTATMSQDAVFAIFGVICVLGVLFVTLRVPEPRGRTLEDIEANTIRRRSEKKQEKAAHHGWLPARPPGFPDGRSPGVGVSARGLRGERGAGGDGATGGNGVMVGVGFVVGWGH